LRGGYGVSYWQTYWSGPVTILGLGYPFYSKQDFISTNISHPTELLGQSWAHANGASSLGYTIVPFTNAACRLPVQFTISTGKLVIPQRYIRATDLLLEEPARGPNVIEFGAPDTARHDRRHGYLRVAGKNNNLGKNINQAPPNPLNPNNQTVNRPLYSQYPQLGDLQAQFSIGTSWYNALTADLRAKSVSF